MNFRLPINIRLPSKRRFNKLASTSLLVCIVFYYTFHLISGNKGVLALLNLEQHVITTAAERSAVQQERILMEQRVSGLYEESLDLDLLDEHARKLLGRTEKDEVMVIPVKAKSRVE